MTEYTPEFLPDGFDEKYLLDVSATCSTLDSKTIVVTFKLGGSIISVSQAYASCAPGFRIDVEMQSTIEQKYTPTSIRYHQNIKTVEQVARETGTTHPEGAIPLNCLNIL